MLRKRTLFLLVFKCILSLLLLLLFMLEYFLSSLYVFNLLFSRALTLSLCEPCWICTLFTISFAAAASTTTTCSSFSIQPFRCYFLHFTHIHPLWLSLSLSVDRPVCIPICLYAIGVLAFKLNGILYWQEYYTYCACLCVCVCVSQRVCRVIFVHCIKMQYATYARII